MRIVYILTSLGMGGAERLVLALGRSMAARGHTVALLVLRPRLPEEWPTNLDVIHLDMRKTPLSILAAILRGRRFLRKFRPDIVHSHGFHGNIVARIFRLLGAGPAPISTIHNVYEGGRLRMIAYRLTDPLSRLTTAVSAAVRERFVRLKAVPARKCVVLANGIDIAEFAPGPVRRERLRIEMNLHGEFIWLAAGRLVPAKDYPNLLRAFAILRSTINSGCPGFEAPTDGSSFVGWRSVCSDLGSNLGSECQLWIAGEGSSIETARLRNLIAELSLEDSVRCLGLRRNLPALLDAADGFVLSSAWEGMPLALAEAMAMKKPVVATDAGGTRELVGDCGTLVPARDPQLLAEAMIRIHRSLPEARKALGRAARDRVEQHFSIDAKAGEWETLYRSLAGDSTAIVPEAPP